MIVRIQRSRLRYERPGVIGRKNNLDYRRYYLAKEHLRRPEERLREKVGNLDPKFVSRIRLLSYDVLS